MPFITSRSWTEADISRLRKLSEEGASITRAAAALNRRTTSVAKVCRRLKITLVGTRQLKAALRALDHKAIVSRALNYGSHCTGADMQDDVIDLDARSRRIELALRDMSIGSIRELVAEMEIEDGGTYRGYACKISRYGTAGWLWEVSRDAAVVDRGGAFTRGQAAVCLQRSVDHLINTAPDRRRE